MLVNNSYWQDNLQRVTDNKSLAQDFCEGSKGWHQGVLLSLVGLWDFQCGWKVPAVQAGSSVESCRFNNSGLRVCTFCPSGKSFKASRGGSSSHAGWWSLFWRKKVWRLCSNYGVNTLLCLWWESLLQGSRGEISRNLNCWRKKFSCYLLPWGNKTYNDISGSCDQNPQRYGTQENDHLLLANRRVGMRNKTKWKEQPVKWMQVFAWRKLSATKCAPMAAYTAGKRGKQPSTNMCMCETPTSEWGICVHPDPGHRTRNCGPKSKVDVRDAEPNGFS